MTIANPLAKVPEAWRGVMSLANSLAVLAAGVGAAAFLFGLIPIATHDYVHAEMSPIIARLDAADYRDEIALPAQLRSQQALLFQAQRDCVESLAQTTEGTAAWRLLNEQCKATDIAAAKIAVEIVRAECRVQWHMVPAMLEKC